MTQQASGTISRADLKKLSDQPRIVLWLDQQQNIVFANLGDLLSNNFSNDAAASAAGIQKGYLYHTNGAVKVCQI